MSDSDFNPFLMDGADDALFIGDEDADVYEVAEEEDYLVVADPTNEDSEEEGDWAVICLTKPYVDFLVKFANIEMRGDEVLFDYTVLSMPETEVDVDPVHFGNYLTSVLAAVLRQFKEDGVLIEEEV